MDRDKEFERREQAILDAIERYNKVHDLYISIFGEHSLDRVILTDPLHPHVPTINKAIKKLTRAIAKNKPLEQIPEEMWKQILF